VSQYLCNLLTVILSHQTPTGSRLDDLSLVSCRVGRLWPQLKIKIIFSNR
jgi:hypothetical protein